jgi:hypothetical protein
MTKKELKILLDKCVESHNDVMNLNKTFGINMFMSTKENFYNKYNYVIYKLFEHIFGDFGRELIEEYVFDDGITFVELCEKLNIYE